MKSILIILILAGIAASTSARRCFSATHSSKSGKIASEAVSHVGSTLWSYASSHKTGTNTNKCNIFVAEAIEDAGASVPHRHWYSWSPIGAKEWLKPSSTYLTNDDCWSLVNGCAQKGDVAAHGGHVGIVTGDGITTSAARDNVVRNDWGFRSGQVTVFWRYVC